MKYNKIVVKLVIMFILINMAGIASANPGENTNNTSLTDPSLLLGSIVPQVSETGKISLSIDGLGVYPGNTGFIQVEKPAGATVRKAYMAAATTGFRHHKLSLGDIKIDGVNFVWSIETPSSISSYNYWGDVTSIVKTKIDAAPAGRVDFKITEKSSDTHNIDGEILAVIFDDPNQTTNNTIVLLFGGQNVKGDTFAIGLAEPINKSDPNLVMDMSLGISYGYQEYGGPQYSKVDVNGLRMTTSAGGEDDGSSNNGALLTVGGLDDTNANPSPYATPTNPRTDDELYNLLPFVKDGDTAINVYTINPSNDDNIFFAALNLKSSIAVVGEGILLSPLNATNPINTQHTVTAKVQDNNGNPIAGRNVTFKIVSGPNVGLTSTKTTDVNGKAKFTYTGTGGVGTDVIVATMVDSKGNTVTSNKVRKTWIQPIPTSVPEFPSLVLPIAGIFGIIFLLSRRKDE